MAYLAIKGHPARGEEVIEILKMFGGANRDLCTGIADKFVYFIEKGLIVYQKPELLHKFICYTLEEFLEKYPYKVGDKVRFSDSNTPFTISRIWWDNNASELICTLEEQDIDVSSVDLQPYKEETMYKVNRAVFDANAQCCDISNKIIKKETMGKEISGAIVDRFICLEGYDFYDDKGNIIDTKEITMKKKKPKYPKTYEECCEVLGINELPYMAYTWNRNEEVILQEYQISTIEKLDRFRKLLICRDVYWKLAGDWEPEYKTLVNNEYFTIHTFNGEIVKSMTSHRQSILAFPTEEIRDKFYENFKDLIEKCNELL